MAFLAEKKKQEKTTINHTPAQSRKLNNRERLDNKNNDRSYVQPPLKARNGMDRDNLPVLTKGLVGTTALRYRTAPLAWSTRFFPHWTFVVDFPG